MWFTCKFSQSFVDLKHLPNRKDGLDLRNLSKTITCSWAHRTMTALYSYRKWTLPSSGGVFSLPTADTIRPSTSDGKSTMITPTSLKSVSCIQSVTPKTTGMRSTLGMWEFSPSLFLRARGWTFWHTQLPMIWEEHFMVTTVEAVTVRQFRIKITSLILKNRTSAMIRVRATDNFLMSYIHFDILAYQIVNCIEISRGQFKI